jgi:transmembrane sensor
MPHQPEDSIAAIAARWLARRDRGLSSAEQDEYLAWLGADPRHREALKTEQATFARLMKLHEWQPAFSRDPNPDLFAPSPPLPPTTRAWRSARAALGAGLAAALLLVAIFFQSPPSPEAGGSRSLAVGEPLAAAPRGPAESPYLVRSERVSLEDGSVIELKAGSRLTTAYTRAERRVRLEGGSEGYFSVARDPSRPFIVEAAGIEAMALGTVFSVRVDTASVVVLVTEGRVRVAASVAPLDAPLDAPVQKPLEAFLEAGERAQVVLDAGVPREEPSVVSVSPEEIRSTLQWQTPHLSFEDTPLEVAVAEFNRFNDHRILVTDPHLRATRIGGAFRVDNVEGFLRSLELTLDAEAVHRGEGTTVLRRAQRSSL